MGYRFNFEKTNQKDATNKSDWMINSMYVGLVSAILFSAFALDKDIGTALIIVSICVISVWRRKFLRISDKYGLVIKLLSLFIFMHFFLFPLIYLKLLKLNPEAFSIDEAINKNEISQSLEDLLQAKDSVELERLLNFSEVALNSKTSLLDTSFHYFSKGNLIRLDTYFIGAENQMMSPENNGEQTFKLNIYDTSGLAIGRHFFSVSQDSFETFHLKQAIVGLNKEITKELSDYKYVYNRLAHLQNSWHFTSILPYAVSMPATGNLRPATRWANIWVTIHWLAVVGLLLGVIGNIIAALFFQKPPENIDDDWRRA